MSKLENFLNIAKFNKATGCTNFCDISKHFTLSTGGNGGGWCRLDAIFGKKYKAITVNQIGQVRYSWDVKEQEIKDIENDINAFCRASGILLAPGNQIRLLRLYGYQNSNYTRPIRKNIREIICKQRCVSCGTNNNIEPDHKNGLYNDPRVLSTRTQTLDDFQALCRHCNLEKREIIKQMKKIGKRIPATIHPAYKILGVEYTCGDDTLNPLDPGAMVGTLWYDYVAFTRDAKGLLLYKDSIANKEMTKVPTMNTLNYIGCKNKLFKTILKVLQENINNISKLNFTDLFAGTGVVGFNMKKHFKSVNANDLEYYSFVINKALLKCRYSEKLQNIIDHCNELEGDNGLITTNFSPAGDVKRMFFTVENSRKADSIRQHIAELKDNGQIKDNEHDFLVASLLVSLDKVANTASVYGAYLKKFKKSALKPFKLVPVHTDTSSNSGNVVTQEKAEFLAGKESYDVVYMDPPYNNRQYSANYSPLNYIAMYDENVKLKGKTGLIENYNKSSFCVKKTVTDTFAEMIEKINCKYLLLSYNNEGLVSFEELKKILLDKGDVMLYKIKYPKFKSQANDEEKEYVCEYMWFVDCVKGDIPFFTEVDLDM